jgi:glutathione S-transferase
MLLPKLKLISFSMCAYVQRARIVLLEKNIPHEVEYIDLNAPPPWFFDVSPLEKVPLLLVDDTALFESMVICDYLDEITSPSLYPDDPLLKARQRGWIVFGDGILDTVYSLLNAEDEKGFKRAKATILDRLDAVEECLQEESLFASEIFGMVDVNYAPTLRFLTAIKQHAQLDLLEDMPQLAAWAQRLLARPSVRDSVPAGYTEELPGYLGRPGSVLKSLIESQ